MFKKYALIGYPAKHSLSPVLLNQAFRTRSVDAAYKINEIRPDQLTDFIKNVRGKPDWGGFNCTMPFKQAIMPYLDAIDPMAEKLQSVNTVDIRHGKLIGYSTDGAGFWTEVAAENMSVTLLGTGGAARAIAAFASAYGVQHLSVFKHAAKNFEQTRARFNLIAADAEVALMTDKSFDQSLMTSDIVINATKVGMVDHQMPLSRSQIALFHPGQTIYDLIYRPAQTAFLQASAQTGATTHNGLSMLLHQAALAFQIWTGLTAPVAEMADSIKQK